MKRNKMQATISLECSLHVRGFDDVEQTFIIDYGADVLIPGTDLIDLEDSEYTLPSPGHVERITRSGANADLKILRLKIRKRCPIWCPPSTGRIAPIHDSDAAFAHLRQLAQSTVVDVLFDYTWVHVENRPMLKDIFDDEQRKAFSTLPKLPEFVEQHRKEDWTVFSPVDSPAAAGEKEGPGRIAQETYTTQEDALRGETESGYTISGGAVVAGVVVHRRIKDQCAYTIIGFSARRHL